MPSPEELRIEHIITHGREASGNGVLIIPDGKRFAFCDVFSFNGTGKTAKIRKMTSYFLETK